MIEIITITEIWFNSFSPGKFFMLFCRLLIFFKINFLEIFCQGVIQFGYRKKMSGPDLGPICLQRL